MQLLAAGRNINKKFVKRIFFLSPLILSFCFSYGLAANQDSFPALSILPQVKSQMLSAGFWIAQHPSPDKTVLSSKEIKNFNGNVQDNLKLTKDIFSLVKNFQTESLLENFKRNIEEYSNKGFYLADGSEEDNNFVDRFKKNMHLSAIVLGLEPRYGLITNFANQRFLPTNEGLYAKKGDLDFDELQNSALDVGTAVAIVHQSLDKKWYYVLSSLSDGWVEADKIAFGDRQQIKNYVDATSVALITSPKADIFIDSTMIQWDGFVRMGNKFPLLQENDTQWIVQIPLKDKDGQLQLANGYILKSQAYQGYLPYTARTIYNQAFLMLDKPYGWGDANGNQDCSRFLQMVFATVGLKLPRDSSNQAQVGELLASFDEKTGNKDKSDALQKALGGVTILPMKGHIMLYLGMVNNAPFSMHASSGYSETKGEREIKHVLNRIVVSDLFLGESSLKGSLLKRLSKVVGIQ